MELNFQLVSETHKNMKNFILRGKNGWCPEDTWNLDIYLSKVISETTGYLSRTIHGFPPELTFKKWKGILNKISKWINAPNVLDESVNNMGKYNEQSKLAYKKQKEALKLFVKYFNNLWD
jgi:hypothetical protein